MNSLMRTSHDMNITAVPKISLQQMLDFSINVEIYVEHTTVNNNKTKTNNKRHGTEQKHENWKDIEVNRAGRKRGRNAEKTV